MKLVTDADFIKYDIHLSRWLLIKARVARQQATIAKEFAMKEENPEHLLEKAQALYDEAEDLRKSAKALLVSVEMSNGRRFTNGQPVFPLKEYLKGKFYKAWDEFDLEYAKIGSPFYGRDPE